MNDSKAIVLAFSGGLDTSFCVPYLKERGYRVTTVFVDTGGVSAEEHAFIESRAVELGADHHLTIDAGVMLWSDFVEPFIMAGIAYQDQYPLLCSDRYIIVKSMIEVAKTIGTHFVAHGCTAMGNDQVRFDQSIRSLGDFEIIAPIRETQEVTKTPRQYEIDYLQKRGIRVQTQTSRYTVNRNLLGVTISGSEIDEFKTPGKNTYYITSPANDWPNEPYSVAITFEHGKPIAINGSDADGPEILAFLNESFGNYGIGRGIYTGDTTIGLKGRIVYECPGLTALLTAHRALEEAVLTKLQNSFKPVAARKWVDLVYQGFFFDPLKRDLESLIRSSQEFVTGTVTVATSGGACHAVEVESPHILSASDATYAQSANWSSREAEGFIKLFGQSSSLFAKVNAPAT